MEKKTEKLKFRPPQLVKFQSVGLTEIGYRILRRQKKKQGKSMMQIVEDDLIQKYGTDKD